MENCKSRTLPRAGSVSASRIADRKGAHGRANSDPAVDRPCSRLIRPQGPHRLFSQVSRRGLLLVAQTHMDSGAMRIRASREVRPEREVTKRAATPRSSGQ